MKFYEGLTLPMIRALQEACARHGLKIMGHVPAALTYEEARPWAKSIKQKVVARDPLQRIRRANIGITVGVLRAVQCGGINARGDSERFVLFLDQCRQAFGAYTIDFRLREGGVERNVCEQFEHVWKIARERR